MTFCGAASRQACGLLVPVGVALGGVVAINALVRTDPGLLGSLLNYHPPLISPHNFGPGISYGSLGRARLLPLLVRDGLAVVIYGRMEAGEGSRVA